MLPSSTTTLHEAETAIALSWARMARLLAAAAIVGAIIGGMG